jgi:hypothetical protein
MVICYILWLFWYIIPVLVCCSTKNLATLLEGSFLKGLSKRFVPTEIFVTTLGLAKLVPVKKLPSGADMILIIFSPKKLRRF